MESLDTVLQEDEPADMIEVRVWNDTVANLILMAFGTASPEILLSIIETVGHHFESGKLGPGTIVGSAAFNLLIITSICMFALPSDETRRISRLQVFIVTAMFSFSAYIWLLLILRHISPDEIELWEASVTFILFPIMILFAYAADRDYFRFLRKSNEGKTQLELESYNCAETEKVRLEKQLVREDGKIDKQTLVNFVKEVKKFPGLSDEEIALLTASKLVETSPHSSMWYRIGGCRQFSSRRKVTLSLNAKLKEVYSIIKSHPAGLDFGSIPKQEYKFNSAIVEFHAPSVGVKENVGTYDITVLRRGNLQTDVKVRVDSIDGTAKQGEDYERVREIITFAKGETEKKVQIKIIDDKKWEPEEEFFLRLTIIGRGDNIAKLGKYPIMEVKIMDDDEPGILTFEKRGIIVKESVGTITVSVVRTHGADGDVSVKWKTVDKSAISKRDYIGGEGTLYFKHNETKQSIEIEIIDDLTPEKDEYFEIVLFDATDGAVIGNINRILITISNDDDFNSMVHRLFVMTNTNLDAIKVHSETIAEQVKQAMNVNGGDIENATTFDYVMHFLTFFWKVVFAFVPPPAVFNGWLCFFVSLVLIGIMTTIIGDLATRFGCFIGLDDTITAITIVALGTSLPDILGARMVTKGEKHADGALVHISGSIAVNVLIGVGAPWLVAAWYHYNRGSKFIVHAGGLEFSVLMFSVAAVIAVTLLMVRRQLSQCGKAEIGGPVKGRYVTAAILIILWILYLLLTFLQITEVINPQFF